MKRLLPILLLFLASCSLDPFSSTGIPIHSTPPIVTDISYTKSGNLVHLSWTVPNGSFKSLVINRVNPVGYPMPVDTLFAVGDLITYYNSVQVLSSTDTIKYCNTKIVVANNQIITQYVDTLFYKDLFRYQISLSDNLNGINHYTYTDLLTINN